MTSRPARTTVRGLDGLGPASPYIVPNSWNQARRRLELLEACYDAASFKRASALGVREGWRCLDAGAGHGSFARWLGSQVGAAGMTAVGEPAHVIDQGQADLAEEQRWFHGPAMVTAWGRRPPL